MKQGFLYRVERTIVAVGSGRPDLEFALPAGFEVGRDSELWLGDPGLLVARTPGSGQRLAIVSRGRLFEIRPPPSFSYDTRCLRDIAYHASTSTLALVGEREIVSLDLRRASDPGPWRRVPRPEWVGSVFMVRGRITATARAWTVADPGVRPHVAVWSPEERRWAEFEPPLGVFDRWRYGLVLGWPYEDEEVAAFGETTVWARACSSDLEWKTYVAVLPEGARRAVVRVLWGRWGPMRDTPAAPTVWEASGAVRQWQGRDWKEVLPDAEAEDYPYFVGTGGEILGVGPDLALRGVVAEGRWEDVPAPSTEHRVVGVWHGVEEMVRGSADQMPTRG